MNADHAKPGKGPLPYRRPSASIGGSGSLRPACGKARPACVDLVLWGAPGIFVVKKPRGPSSFDMIRAARRELGIRKIGHAGTLDPLAEGVLVLGAGRGTKLLAFFAGADKSYRVVMRLGVRTDSFDITGKVVEESDPSGVKKEDLRRALDRFRGEIEQVPPMWSALKHRGRPLYRLARKGVEVERRPRRVEIARLELERFSRPACAVPGTAARPEAELSLDCSKGTYVRSLVDDIGRTLGCGAVVARLVRTRVGPFTLEEAREPGGLTG
jgi:tRNA pseudouridine55 synthase